MTDLHTARQSTHSNTLMLDTLLSAMVDQIILIGRDGRIRYANNNVLTTLGCTHAQVFDQHWSDVVMPYGYFEPVKQHLPRVISQQRVVRIQHERKRNNDSAYFEYILTPVRGTEVPLALVQIRDVTDQRKMNDAVQDSETRLGITLDNSPIGMAMLDVSGVLFSANQKLSELYAVSLKELTGKNIRSLIHTDDLEEFLVMVECMLEGQQRSFQQVLRIFDAAENACWVELTLTMVRNTLGQPHYFILQVVDIHVQKALEIENARLQRGSKILLNEIANPALLVDRNHSIKNWNNRVNMLFGYSDEDLATLSLTHLFVTDITADIQQYLQRGGTLEDVLMQDRVGNEIACDLRLIQLPAGEDGRYLLQVLRHPD